MASATKTLQNRVDEKKDAIIVLNFRGQYVHRISKRIRELGVYSEIVPHDITPEELEKIGEKLNVKGIVLSGGPDSVYEKDAPTMDPQILDMGIPVLGLCYGHQLIAKMLGGKVEPSDNREFGQTEINVKTPEGVLSNLPDSFRAIMSHGDKVTHLSDSFRILASTKDTLIAAFRKIDSEVYGLQWHPEVVDTQFGKETIHNFIYDICKCSSNWSVEHQIEGYVNEIKAKVGNDKCLIALSGGVDSSVATALIAKAVGNNLKVVYVDTGLMRKNETEEIKETFEKLHVDMHIVYAGERFFNALEGVTDPENKRKIVGALFARIFEEEAREINAEWLCQGTIYPDIVESGDKKKSAVIKTHHNVGGLPPDIKFKGVVEPLRDLYKYEVRQMARALGLPAAISERQPFPGPGLSIRVIGEVTADRVAVLQDADYFVRKTIDNANANERLGQYFAVLGEIKGSAATLSQRNEEIQKLATSITREEIKNAGIVINPNFYSAIITGIKSTGVKGDGRAYGDTIMITEEIRISGDKYRLPWEVLENISRRLTGEIREVNRVVIDITDSPYYANAMNGKYMVAIRAIESEDFMTGQFSKLPWNVLEKAAARVTGMNSGSRIDRIVYDITGKPPATVEWE